MKNATLLPKLTELRTLISDAERKLVDLETEISCEGTSEDWGEDAPDKPVISGSSPVQSMADMEQAYVEHQREKTNHFRRTDQSLILLCSPEDPENSPQYEIPLWRMKTDEKALDWIRQLSEKRWCTLMHLRIFLATAAQIREDKAAA